MWQNQRDTQTSPKKKKGKRGAATNNHLGDRKGTNSSDETRLKVKKTVPIDRRRGMREQYRERWARWARPQSKFYSKSVRCERNKQTIIANQRISQQKKKSGGEIGAGEVKGEGGRGGGRFHGA